MKQHSLPDRLNVREAIMERIKMATSGRPVPETGRPDGSFVHIADTSLTEAFAANLHNISGNVNFYETGFNVLEALKNLVEVNCWKKIACPDKQIATFLSSSAISVDFEKKLSIPNFDNYGTEPNSRYRKNTYLGGAWVEGGFCIDY